MKKGEVRLAVAMRDLIAKSYGSASADSYDSTGLTELQIRHVLLSAQRVISEFPPDPWICTFINACWAVDVMQTTGIGVHVVAGNFLLGQHTVFSADDDVPISELIKSFNGGNQGKSVGWGGHVWCDFNGMIADGSIIMTAPQLPNTKLPAAVLENLYPGTPFILSDASALKTISYEPRHVLSESEIVALVQGAANHLNRVLS